MYQGSFSLLGSPWPWSQKQAKQSWEVTIVTIQNNEQRKKFNWLLRVSSWYFMPFLPIPNTFQLASQGVPLILSTSHFMASSKMDGMTLESFITWSMHQAKQTHFHHFMPFLPIPNAFQLASQGVPLILSTSHFMASSKMDGMTLESFITWSMHQAKQTNYLFHSWASQSSIFRCMFTIFAFFVISANTNRISTGFSGCPLDIVNEPFHGLIENGWHDTWVLHHMKHASSQTNAFPPFHAISANTKRIPTGFSGCPLDIVNEPFHGLIENGWHDTWVLHHMKHASSQTNAFPPFHALPFLPIPIAFQLASQGVPLILSTSHFMTSSKMDGMTLQSFITWSMHQAKQTNYLFHSWASQSSIFRCMFTMFAYFCHFC